MRREIVETSDLKLQYWRGFRGIFAAEAAPVQWFDFANSTECDFYGSAPVIWYAPVAPACRRLERPQLHLVRHQPRRWWKTEYIAARTEFREHLLFKPEFLSNLYQPDDIFI